jgi:hypothetical protein
MSGASGGKRWHLKHGRRGSASLPEGDGVALGGQEVKEEGFYSRIA